MPVRGDDYTLYVMCEVHMWDSYNSRNASAPYPPPANESLWLNYMYVLIDKSFRNTTHPTNRTCWSEPTVSALVGCAECRCTVLVRFGNMLSASQLLRHYDRHLCAADTCCACLSPRVNVTCAHAVFRPPSVVCRTGLSRPSAPACWSLCSTSLLVRQRVRVLLRRDPVHDVVLQPAGRGAGGAGARGAELRG